MIRFVRGGQAGKFVGMRIPIEVTAVYDCTAYACRMAVHIFGCRMSYDIGSPFERAAVDRCRKCVIHDQRHAMTVGDTGELLDIEYAHARIGQGFAKQSFCVRTESGRYFFFRSVRIDECHFDTQLFHCHAKQVERPTVDRGRANHMVAGLADVEYGIEIGSLPGGSQYGAYATFQSSDLGCDSIVCRVLQAGVEISAFFEVEEFGHLFAGVILECRALIDRQDARFSFFRLPSSLHTEGFRL